MSEPAIPNSGTAGPRKALTAPRLVIAIIVIGTLVRLCLAAMLPLGVDESYTVGIARQFSLSYFDHPPLHLWIVGLWAKLWGSEAVWLLRLPFVALFALSSWLMYGLTRMLFGSVAGAWAVAILNLAPVFGLAHGSWVVPDGPLIAASLGMAGAVSAIVFAPRGSNWGRWLLAGALAGLALLSKYHGVLLVGGLFLFLVSTGQRRWLARPQPWVAALLALVMQAPVLIWNATHDWASFAFQAGRGLQGGVGLEWLRESLLGQGLYLLPWILAPLAIVLVRALIGGPRHERRWLLVCLAILPIVIFTALTLFSRGLPHWQMPGWLFAIPLLGEALASARPLLRRIAMAVAVATALVLTVLGGAFAVQARWGVFDPALRSVFGAHDPTDLILSWDSLETELARHGLPAEQRSFIATFHWITAAQLNAVFGRQIPVICLCRDARHFTYLHDGADFTGWTGIIIDDEGRLQRRSRYLAAHFDSIAPGETITVMKGDRAALRLGLRVGAGFRP